ncbi:unnamed protein product [Spodoptera littoralis]|uniref:Hemolin n=1 Tax=Spodoptera littoralis TaxID=7109 RepID=A0A9P0HUT8_SPOLI|nr:unnamed protein product [Spodoptera littoralis]CAH1634796.1 unnamed protein product [Spodoptera littoralis]
MTDDINQVKSSVNRIMDIVFNEKASVISNMVLVTFNDPDAKMRIATTNRSDFNRALEAVNVHNYANEECREPSINGIILALNKSNRGSHIYVFTDASAKDYQNAYIVKELCQKKQSQISFVITGRCTWHYPDEIMHIYYDIAQACSGLAYEVNKNAVSEVLRPITDIISGEKIIITATTVPAGVLKDIPFDVDDQTEYVIVSVSGKDVYLKLSGPAGKQENLMWNANGKVVKLVNVTPGRYTATVKGTSETSVVIVGRSDFLFKHGFSELKPKSLKDTSLQPIANTNVHLSVLVTDERQSVEITKAQILGMDEKPIRPDIPLTKISKDFYVTPALVTPTQRFKVAVIGRVKATGRIIKRIAKIPITPQEPPIKLPDKQVPRAVISEGRETTVEYNSSMKLTCKVTAFPKPKISWYNQQGKLISSKSSMIEYPYDYISYLEMPVAKEDKYICSAVNDVGTNTASIKVNVKDAFSVVNVRPSVNMEYGKPGILKCDIKSRFPMDIHWYYMNEMTGAKKEVVNSNEYSISADKTGLTIKKVDMHSVGKYVCQAYLVNDRNVKKELTQRVQVTGVAPPKIQIKANVKAVKGKTVVLECKVSGVPVPTIKWQFRSKSGSKFVPLTETRSVLRINNIQAKHEGQYKCVAENALAKDEKVTTLIVQEIPRMVSSASTTYQSTEGDASLKIPCVAVGNPKPSITWKMDGRPIAVPSAKYVVEDGALVIRNPTVADTKSYECVATNEAGSVSTTFKTFIRQKPQVVGVATKKVNLGMAVDIECRVVKGWPKPNIRWFVDNSGKQFVPIAGSSDVMHIARAENKHTGRYKCVVQNEAGTVEHVTSLTVESRPDIVTKSKSVEAIEGDIAIKIPCDVVGVPRPTITWKLKGAIITPNAKYSFDNGSLVILNPSKIDVGKYTCEAKNYLGSVSSTTDLTLEKSPSTFGTTHFVYLLYGENRNIECEAYRSKSQSIKWFDNEGELKKKSIQITKATVSNDGNYTCHVSDKQGHTETHTYVVDVGGPPKLLGDNPLNDWRGEVQEIRSNCDSDAKPQAKVQWKYNGKLIPDSDVQDIGVIYKWGHYTCNVSNPHGSVLKDFDVKSSVCLIPKNLKDIEYMPLILDDKGAWPTWETSKYFSVVEQEEKITLSCPNRKDASNSFKKFPSKTVLKAYCDKEDVFIVDGKRAKLFDLQCTQGIQPTVAKKNVKCLTDNSELIKVGYNTGSFLETYEVCFDNTVRMPRYIRNIVTAKNDKLSSTYAWHTYPGIENSHNENAFTCKNKLSSCCYAKSQLVEANDFKYAAEMNTTFIDPLNVVPAWRPCYSSQTSWESVNKMVREQTFYDEFIVWSGTDTWQKKDGAVIPRYLWKVIRFDDDEVFAIIHVNDRAPTDSDIKCKNVCNSEGEPWFKVSDKYTYCCSLSDFLKAFDYHDASIGGPLSNAE